MGKILVTKTQCAMKERRLTLRTNYSEINFMGKIHIVLGLTSVCKAETSYDTSFSEYF